MISHRQEKYILERAVERGFLSQTDYDTLETYLENEVTVASVQWSATVDRLLSEGKLLETDVKAWLASFDDDAPTLIGPQPSPNGFELSLVKSETRIIHHATREGRTTSTLAEKRIFPVENWDRYEFAQLLGEGGMGQVFKARDLRLGRIVALKFIRGNNPRFTERFLQEARAQARIAHENICKVYEVGEVNDLPYIAMEYIEGAGVKELRDQMSLEQKVRVIRDAAEALHTAHRIGVIHRDIKPANIMVVRAEDGSWKPCVMDFGLARDMESRGGLTETGAIMGTPSYMAPEQARGASENLDRRTDVYSLGATLYDLLAGCPPFEDDNVFNTLMKVIEEEPKALRKIARTIPQDLETITMKCLEKEPHMRYESAKALADDLQRYLDGEPIEAQQTTLVYWAVKKAKKHKPLVITMGVATVLVLMAGIFALYTWLNAAEQARLAQIFGQDAEKIEAILHQSYMLPLHDTRKERTMVLARLENIRTRMEAAGNVSEGAGNLALGRGYLALQDYERARKHLELAWNRGYRNPDVAYALGRVLGKLYHKELEEAEHITNRQLREFRKQQIEKQYAQPAMDYLNRYISTSGNSQIESSQFVESEIAFFKKDYARTLEKAQAAYEQIPWLYEAQKLQGDVFIALAREQQERGSYDEALKYLERAGQYYGQAAAIGQSDAAIYIGEAERWLQAMEIFVVKELPLDEVCPKALSACDRAITVNPENGAAYSQKANVLCRYGIGLKQMGADPRAPLEKSIALAREALRFSPQDSQAYWCMGTALQMEGRYALDHGQEPLPFLSRATESYEQALRLNPTNVSASNSLGNTFYHQGVYEYDNGRDPRPLFAQAIKAYEDATRNNSAFALAYNGLGNTYGVQAEYEMGHGLDPRQSLDLSIASYLKAIELNPGEPSAYFNLGPTYRTRGEYEMNHGQNPTTSFDLAIGVYQKALTISPNAQNALNNLGNVYLSKALYAYLRGENMDPWLQQALLYLNKLSTGEVTANRYNNLARTSLLRALGKLDAGRNPAEDLVQVRALSEKELAVDARSFGAFAVQAQADLLAARWAIQQKQNPIGNFKRAEQELQRALAINAESELLWQIKTELQVRKAEWTATRGGALQEEITNGLEAAAKLLQLNPQNAEGFAWKGKLLQIQARKETSLTAQADLNRQANQLLHQAVSLNPLVGKLVGLR